ncbi:PREDICTED: ABC transporter G family member 20-like [Vollenhovia emeryi]|uniref:ABC transporter G family member 20-like n=1 Tax=Vollenhovia emeryi TaxID=411798 RepID=UPI0005F3FA77|nr:PREDICTED: ABC transporter G family member 20-like [Vollenhovia emeryi]
MSNTVSCFLIVTERLEGVWNRSIVQGVKTEEILLSHIVVESIILVIQTITVILIVFPIWGLECRGSIFTVFVLVFLNGFCGLCYGFIISTFCTTLVSALICSTGSFLPMIATNGSLWPLAGMPTVLRWISFLVPTTLPSQSLRGIIYKNSSISDYEVYIGFITTLGWTVLIFVVTIFGIRLKSP